METIVRNVGDLQGDDLSAAEQLVGHELGPDQQLVIVVQPRLPQSTENTGSCVLLESWWFLGEHIVVRLGGRFFETRFPGKEPSWKKSL